MMNDARNEKDVPMPALYAVADAMPHATVILDRRGIISVANTMASRVLGLSDDCPLDGKSYWQAFPAGLCEIIAAMQREVLIYASDARRDFDFQLPSGEMRFLDLNLAPIQNSQNGDQPTHFCLVMTDSSARHEVVELKKLDILKSNFLGLVSHELRTPLTSIRGAVHLLAETEPDKSENATALVDIIHSNSERLIRLVNNLLEMVAIDNDTFTVSKSLSEVESVISQVLERHEAAAKAKFITLLQTGQDVQTSMDPERFGQLVSHLVENAIKFTPHGGKITVGVQLLSSGHLQLTVSDTGCGIPAYARDKIFDKFYQVEDSMTRCCGGAGVGLYLARYIVQMHGGQIWMDPNNEGGSDFHVIFPAHAPQVTPV